MADKINLSLEKFIPELEVFVENKVFTKNDIKKIIKKRRQYEYTFERKDVTKADFFKAIKYEKILDKRRVSKKKDMNLKKMTYYDFHFIRRIVFLFKKCLIKFKKDELIWIEFFNFLIKHKCFNILNKEIGMCIINHPRNLDFWRIAAYNEFENNFNTLAARNIFQKCLRFNKKVLEANVEYFIFELKFVSKIILRREVLIGETNKEKKLNFNSENKIDDVQEIVSDDIIELKVPEIIWLKGVDNLKEVYPILDINIMFLSALMKYGNKLKYKRLKTLIIKDILEKSEDNTYIRCKIIEACLDKYSDEKEYLKKSIKKFSKIMSTDKNRVISYVIESIKKKFPEKANELNDYLLNNICINIDLNDLIENYSMDYNKSLSKFIFENSLYSGQSTFDLEIIINKIIENIIQTNNGEDLNDYYDLYWKFLMYNKNQDFEQIYNTIKNVINTKNSSNFFITMINNLCKVIEEDIKIFPDRFADYLNKIDNIIKSKRLCVLEIIKNIWKRLFEIIINQIIITLPKDLSYSVINIDNDSIEYIKLLKNKMKSYLINYNSVTDETKKKYKGINGIDRLFDMIR